VDLKHLKVEEHPSEPEENEMKNLIPQQLPPKMRKRQVKKMAMDHKKVVEIARAYSNLISDAVPRSFLSNNFKGRTIIIACPRCMIPAGSPSRSAFLNLLYHVRRSHAESSEELFADIMNRYAPFIQCMKRMIILKTRGKYLEKLRSLVHRDCFLGK